MLHIQIDAHSGIPVYRQIMDQIKYYTASGALAAGAMLPSIRQLAQELAVNPTTIVKAYTELQHEGVMEMRQGKGAFISEQARRMSSKEHAAALRRLVQQLAVEAAQMGASHDEVAQMLRNAMDRFLGKRGP